MANLVRLEHAAEVLGTTPSSLTVTAWAHKDKKGVYPRWYISDGKRGGNKSYIDVDELDRNRQIVRRAWLYASDHLYWMLEAAEGYNISHFAAICSEINGDSKASWLQFLSADLWNIPQSNCYELKKNKLFDFIKVATRFIYVHKHCLKFKELA